MPEKIVGLVEKYTHTLTYGASRLHPCCCCCCCGGCVCQIRKVVTMTTACLRGRNEQAHRARCKATCIRLSASRQCLAGLVSLALYLLHRSPPSRRPDTSTGDVRRRHLLCSSPKRTLKTYFHFTMHTADFTIHLKVLRYKPERKLDIS